MAIVGVVLGVVSPALTGWRAGLNAETFVQNLAYDINLARSQTQSTAVIRRVVLVNATTYRVERQSGSTWEVAKTVRGNNAALTSLNTGACSFEFDTRGFMIARTCAGAATSNTNITATVNSRPRTILVTALGLARGI